MPNNLKQIIFTPGATLPVLPQQFTLAGQTIQLTFTKFTDTRILPMLTNTYKDGTFERSLISDGENVPISWKTWKISMRLRGFAMVPLEPADTVPPLVILRNFWEDQMGFNSPTGEPVPLAFWWYNPFEADPELPIGSNYDPTGDSPIGRHSAFFRGAWIETTNLRLTEVSLQMVEVF